jgi:glyoxylase-like metal-dependent hydrolase (beta-lactamase superfamily II)
LSTATSTHTTTIAALYEGTFSVGLDKKFHRIDRDAKPKKGALKLSLNPFLIQTPERNMLIDAGLGEFGENTSCEVLLDHLHKFDLTNLDITDIFLSHLHYDHMGGLAERCDGFWELTFPDAKLWVSKEAWEEATAKEVWYDETKTEFLHFLDAKADLHFLDAEDQPYPDVRVKRIGGHTQFHQVIYIERDEINAMMAGDVLATRGHVNRKFAAKYDYDSKQSIKARDELTQQAFEGKYIILGYHENHQPLFRLTDYENRKGYTIDNLGELFQA